MTSPPPTPSTGARTAGAALGAILLAVMILIFVAVYLSLPGDDHFNALLAIGVVALVFAALSYLSEAYSTRPLGQRSLAWGMYGMGFAILLLTLGLAADPNGELSMLQRIIGLIVVLIVLAFSVWGIFWRARQTQAETVRTAERQRWESRPAPSAFDYSTARPARPPTPPPSPPAFPPPPAGGP